MSVAAFLGAAIGALYRERRYDVARMEATQRARLVRLLMHAKQRTRLGARRLSDVDPAAADLTGISPMDKAALMAEFDASITDDAVSLEAVRRFTAERGKVGGRLSGRYVCATTSGTTGRVGYFVTDEESWARLNGALIARILRHRLVPRDVLRFSPFRRYRMAMTVAAGGHFITKLVSTFQPTLAKAIMRMEAFSITAPREDVIRDLNRYRPHYLHSYPTYLELLAHEQMQGRLRIDPEFISLGSEPVSSMARASLRCAFPNAELSETYGATECLTMANQCRHGRLHANTDLCVIEPVDEAGRLVPVGVRSDKVWVTNLLNLAQPLIRYELDDSVTILDEACPCGAGLPVIRVEGRSDDTFFLSDASGRFTAHPPVPFEVLFLDAPGLEQYQLVHEVQNALCIRLVAGPGADGAELERLMRERFRDYLQRNALDGTVEVEVQLVNELEREKTGHKLRQIVSRVARPGGTVAA